MPEKIVQTPRDRCAALPSGPLKAYCDFHEDLCLRARELSVRKNADYSRPQDAPEDPYACFRNFMRVEASGLCSTETGLLVRLEDKMSRLNNLLKSGADKAAVADESIDDTILDAINYLALLAAYRFVKAKQKAKKEESV